MQIHSTIQSLRQALSSRTRVAFAPTMGNLHEGHASLMREGARHADTVVASVFVNRTQFGPNEDFDQYPRTLEADCALLEKAGVHHVFAPAETELYPTPQSYYVTPSAAHDGILEGALRPGHFRGAATVVCKLFNIVQPDVALFGKKDYQQLMVLRNMVRELCLPIEIIGCPIIRAEDGLALSSRNGYLSQAERAEAPRLQRELAALAAAVRGGETDFARLENTACAHLTAAGWQPDYVTLRRRSDLQTPAAGDELVVLAAARIGRTRLIDNIEI